MRGILGNSTPKCRSISIFGLIIRQMRFFILYIFSIFVIIRIIYRARQSVEITLRLRIIIDPVDGSLSKYEYTFCTVTRA